MGASGFDEGQIGQGHDDGKHVDVVQYRRFYHERLKPDLDDANAQRASIDEEWKSCEDLVKNLKVMQAGKDRKATITRTLMHLGADVYAHAEVANPETIYVFVGLGFYVQCSLEEAEQIASSRMSHLEARRARLDDTIASIKANITLVLEGIRQLKGLD